MLSLNRNYIQVERNGRLSYGGSQMWSDNPTVKICGCGPVAVLDTLLYLTHRQESPMSLAEYNRMLEEMSKRYFPLVRPFGINGLLLAAGMNRLLRRYRLPYRAFWAISGRKFWSRVEELLCQDLPVIFSVGPNFPAVWQKHRLTFYRKTAEGLYIPASSAKSHYITATGIDQDWLRISSWGRRYYVNRKEFEHYARRKSIPLVGNILYIERKP